MAGAAAAEEANGELLCMEGELEEVKGKMAELKKVRNSVYMQLSGRCH